jgi:hypothetical protein
MRVPALRLTQRYETGRAAWPWPGLTAPGALAGLPLGVRVTAAVCGFAAFLLVKRSLFVGVALGEAVLLAGGYLFMR